jgi:hypothetical protein
MPSSVEVSPRHFRNVLGHFCTGVVVITAFAPSGRAGRVHVPGVRRALPGTAAYHGSYASIAPARPLFVPWRPDLEHFLTTTTFDSWL